MSKHIGKAINLSNLSAKWFLLLNYVPLNFFYNAHFLIAYATYYVLGSGQERIFYSDKVTVNIYKNKNTNKMDYFDIKNCKKKLCVN